MKRIVIIGGVAGGMSTATRLRRVMPDARITVLERGQHVSFANCGLPYYAGGVITERDALLLQTPEALKERFDLDVRVLHEVTSIDRDAKIVRAVDHGSGAGVDLAYDELVISTGASPLRPPIPGLERALSLRDVADVDAMVAALDRQPASAVVLGGGFIGIEMAENLRHRGVPVTLVEMADQVMAPFDPEMAVLVADRLEENGVTLRLGVKAVAVGADDVELSDGTRVPGDLVVSALGVRPEDGLARDAGLDVAERGGVLVDEQHRTNDRSIFAIGDVAVKHDAVSGEGALVPLAQTANRHGRLVADVIAGREVTSPPVLGTAIVGAFGLQAASVGWNEKRLVAAGRPHRVIHTHPMEHAGYYPGASGLALKLLVDPETDAILGAQAVGESGADKRIDVIATAMRAGMTASDLADLELAYAPQFGSAKDPVNLIGMVADNLRAGERAVQWHELSDRLAEGAVLVDVRSPEEFAAGAIPGAVNIPVDSLRDADLPEGDLIVHCAVGLRGHVAVRALAGRGRNAANLDGGYVTWEAGERSRR